MGRIQDDCHVYMDVQNAAASEVSFDIESPRVLLALSANIDRLVHRNEKSLSYSLLHRKLTLFHGLRPPNISILRYLQRMHKYTNCSPSCFVVGFIFMDRLVHKQPECQLISLNIHRLLITSIMVATKLLEDVHYNNAFYAKVGGISVAELNSLEVDFLFRLQFQLCVTEVAFDGYCTHLERGLMLAERNINRALPIFCNLDEEQTSADEDDTQGKHHILIEHKRQLASTVPSPVFDS